MPRTHQPEGFLHAQLHRLYWVGVPLLVALIATVGADELVDGVGEINTLEVDRTAYLLELHPPEPSESIALVTLSEDSRARLPSKQGFLSRDSHAKIIRKLQQAGAKVLLLDFVFAEPRPDDDAELKAALLEPGRMAITLASTVGEIGDDPAEPDNKLWEHVDLSFLGVTPKGQRTRAASNTVLTPATFDVGAVMYRWDRQRDLWLLHVSLSAVLQFRDIPSTAVRFNKENHELRAGGSEWSLQGNDAILVQWTEDPMPFPRHDLADVLLDYPDNRLKEEFEGKIVILGTIEKGHDPVLTHRGDLHGVDFIAQLVNTLMLAPSERLRMGDLFPSYVWCLTLGALACVAAMCPRFLWMSLGLVTLSISAFAMPPLAARMANVGFETVAPFLTVAIAGVLGTAVRIWIPRPGRPAGSEFEATAMFIDLKSSTTILQNIGPQPFRRLYIHFSSLVAAQAKRFGGEVERTTGDGALIVFPAQRSAHHALSAARAIGPMAEAIRVLGRNQGLDLSVTFGIESGLLTGGYVLEGGRKAWSSSGSAVNMAYRLQEAVDDLRIEVAIGPVAARLIEGHFKLVAAGHIEARGFEGTVQVWTLPGEG